MHPGAYASEADDARLIAVTAEMADGRIGEIALVGNSSDPVEMKLVSFDGKRPIYGRFEMLVEA